MMTMSRKWRLTIISVTALLLGATLLHVTYHSKQLQSRHQLSHDAAAHSNPTVPHSSSYGNTDHDWLMVYPGLTRPGAMGADWVQQLQLAAKQLTSMQVTLVVCDVRYLELLVNWLAHAMVKLSSPLNDIMVISLDNSTHELLQRKGVLSVLVTRDMIIEPSVALPTAHSHIWIIRLSCMRLLNHWGYHVLAMDSDAIPLKPIQPLLDQYSGSDVVSSAGSYPFQLKRQWGVTVCMGVTLIRSSPATSELWLAVRDVNGSVCDDQVRVNTALYMMGIQWKPMKWHYQGQASAGSNLLTVTTLPVYLVCRICHKENLHLYYVWHRHGPRKGPTKRDHLLEADLWLLQQGWNATLWTTQSMKRWLSSIAHTEM